jgi:predicted esterase
MLSLADALRLPDVHYRAPQAPGMTWYPQSFLAPLRANAPGIENGLETIRHVLEELQAEGVPAERIVLIGFSQGACLASEFAARHARRYGGIVALSGGLIGNVQLDGAQAPDDKGFEYEGSLEGTPVLLACSDVDPHIPVERVRQTEEVLAELEGEVDLRIYRGMGHTVNSDEVRAVQRLLERVASG